eukprot:3699028-Rhodomonas_salina.2
MADHDETRSAKTKTNNAHLCALTLLILRAQRQDRLFRRVPSAAGINGTGSPLVSRNKPTSSVGRSGEQRSSEKRGEQVGPGLAEDGQSRERTCWARL